MPLRREGRPKSRTHEYRQLYHAEHKDRELDCQRRYYTKNKNDVLTYQKQYYRENRDRILARNQMNRNTPEGKEKRKIYFAGHREDINRRIVEGYSVPSTRIKRLVGNIRRRTQKTGKAFDADTMQVFILKPPKRCACCRTLLDYSVRRPKYDPHTSRSPSFDRVNNVLSYVTNNVAILCTRCNTLKSDASLRELRLLVKYIETHTKRRK